MKFFNKQYLKDEAQHKEGASHSEESRAIARRGRHDLKFQMLLQ
jgi:hypothetical protein